MLHELFAQEAALGLLAPGIGNALIVRLSGSRIDTTPRRPQVHHGLILPWSHGDTPEHTAGCESLCPFGRGP